MVDRSEALRELARRELARRATVQSGETQEAQANLRALGLDAPQPVTAQNDQSYTGQVLPLSSDAAGNVSFDSNAGLLGALKAAVTAPGRALSGDLPVAGPDGMTSPEAIAEGLNFAGFASPMTPELRAGGYVVPGDRSAMTRAKIDPPAMQELRAAADAGYNNARDMGVEYSSQSVADMARRVQADLEAQGIIDELAPKSFATIRRLQSPPEDSVATISGVDAARRVFGNIGREFANPTDQLAAGTAKRAVDDFLGGPPDGSVLPGFLDQAQDAARTITNARGNYAASRRSGLLSGIEEAADLRAAAANSGQNTGNALRQRIVSLLLNQKASAGFTAGETAQLGQVARGSRTANTTRYIGNLLGGGGGLGAAVSSGLAGSGAAIATGDPMMSLLGLAAPVAGAASKKISNRLTEKALQTVDEATRRRSPLYEQMLKDAPMVRSSAGDTSNLILRLLLASEGAKDGGGGW